MRIIFKLGPSSRIERLAVKSIKAAASIHMTVRLSILAAGLALAIASTADQPPPIGVIFPPDPRVERLERFFHHYNCPTPYHVAEYLRASDGYRLDYRLLPAISIRESLCGAFEQMENNHWGYHPDHQSFPTVDAGIDYVARQLAEGIYYHGKSLQEKLFVYNPRPAYPIEVQRIMRQIE